MKFKRITLSNFRQFRGTQTLEISEDAKKNVTVIIGDNGLGKTTLLQAFKWCLYNVADLENIEVVYNLDEFGCLKDNEIIRTYVEVVIEKDGETFTIRRTKEFQKRGDKAKCLTALDSRPKILVKNKLGVSKDGRDEDIDKLIPFELSTYFFFDGERMKHLGENNETGKKDVSIAVKGIFGLDVYEKLLSYLESLERQYASKLSLRGRYSAEMITTQNLIASYESNLNFYEKQTKHYEEESLKLDKEIKNIDKILAESEVINELHASRVFLEDSERKLRDSLQKQQKNVLDDYIKNAPNLRLSKHFNEIRSMINSNEGMNEATIEGISGYAIDQILLRGQCICGEKFCEFDKHYNKLTELKKYLPPESLSTLLRKTQHQFEQIELQNSEVTGRIEEKIDSYYKSVDDVDETRIKLESVMSKIKISSETISNVAKLEDRRAYCKRTSNELRIKIGEDSIKQKAILKKLADAKLRRYELSALENTNAHTLDVITTIKGSRELILTKYNEIETSVRKKLQDKVQELMNAMLESKRTVAIDKNYRFTVKDAFGGTVMGEGYKVVTSFSYIGGILSIAKELDLINTDCYPLVMDAPYANLDYTNRRTVNSIIPEIAEQIVLFTTDSQWKGSVEDGLSSRVGKAYKLFHNVDESNISKDGDTLIKEVTHDFH